MKVLTLALGASQVDYPMESKIKPRNRIEGDQHKYGNLM